LHEQLGDNGDGQTKSAEHDEHNAEGLHGMDLMA
jgi:hypothetical protein